MATDLFNVFPLKQLPSRFLRMDVGRRAPLSWRWLVLLLVSLVSLVSLVPLAHGHQSEAFFNGTSTLAISNSSFPPSTASTYHLGFSFRACGPTEGGFLLTQVANSDQLHVELLPHDQEGKLKVSLTVCLNNYTVEAGLKLDDNRWHDIDLRFVDGLLQVQLDDERVSIANSSDFVTSPLFKRSEDVAAPIVLGQGYKGCLLEGPSVQFTTMNEDFLNNCPIPLIGNFSAEDDPCWIQPCQNNGVCMATEAGFKCICTLRFAGDRCQEDLGSLCKRVEHSCMNGGTCRENNTGNGTFCVCPDNFSGKICENAIELQKCEVNTCENNGTCYVERGHNLCVCPAGFDGPQCQINIDDCDPSPCKNDAVCVDGVDSFTCNCNGTGFEGDRCETKVDQCLSNPCHNGGTCFDRYNKYVCQCLAGFSGLNCHLAISSRMLKELECEPDTCLNGGICSVTGGELECLCQNGFTGARCDVIDDKCLNVSCPENAICVEGINSHRCICQPGFSGSPPNCVEVNECDSSPCANNATCKDGINGYECVCRPGFGGSNCETDVDECASAPCLNGGVCVDSIGTHTCQCPAGFDGDRCQIDVDECADNPCVHAASCKNLAGKYVCECEPGWKGLNCDEDIDECLSSPCMNNATCVNQLNAFLCQCPDGLTGKRCETNVDDCTPNPCRNNSTCVDLVGNYSCVCPPQLMGRHCEDVFDACGTSPCQNGASCITTPPQQDFTCECVAGYEGIRCENNIDECVNVQCSEGKQCFDLINGFECRCPLGFTGALCLDDIDDCVDNPCQNGGSCIDAVGNYTCSCPKGFTGRNCESDVDECSVLEPCVYGICQNTVGSYQCYCRPGFSGDNCNLEFDECLSHPCNNNGTCNNLINGYECVCAPGFTGKDCDININECESSPCQNNATCIDAIAAFTCVCPAGFTGDRCHINIDECQSGPCQNEGLCVDGVNSYRCDCSDTGFKGDHCEFNVDDCESAPCTHGSQCVDLVKDYSCTCFPGYDGKNCENDINECDAVPCQNGATCLERSNRTLYDLSVFTDFAYNTSGGYVCRCLPGFEGDDCQVNIDECALSSTRPCKFGECIDGVNNYTCRCDPGYEGDDCDLEIDECERFAPCVHGKCVDLVADYQCNCTDNYGGKNCSVELLGCIDVTCLHGGTCLPFLADETEHKFTCQCPYGFHGELCQHATTMSFNGSSFMAVQTNRDEGYDLSLRFRTTLPNGLLAVGQGQTFYRLELSNGQLNLHSSLLNKWEGVFLGNNLNDAEWQTIRVRFNLTHLHLVVNQQEALYPINPVESVNSTETSFGMTVLGGATSFLRILAQGVPFFVGCMENVVVNDNWVIPSASPGPATAASDNIIRLSGVAVEVGCPREDHCRPNPCQNDGVCNDMWTFFNCSCQRPYLGDNCQLSYTAATFGHENSSASLVSVSITPQERLALSNSMDVSLFVRTREETGLIFYLGTPPPASTASSDGNKWASYIAAELRDGQLLVVAELGDSEQIFTVDSIPLNDGNSHLIQVIRDRLDLQVRINGTDYLNDTLRSFRPLQAEVLFLGGLPSAGRSRRQITGVTTGGSATSPSSTLSSRVAAGASNVLEGRHFKGVLQDIQIKSGNITRVVQIFPLEAAEEDIPESLGTIQSNEVLEGVVSDNACVGDPCVKGNCTVTWNDYMCICPTGFKGKNCSEMEFCAIHQCPSGGVCQNLNDGYECLSSATFNGVNNTIDYASVGIDSASVMDSISFSFRTKAGGTVLSVRNDASRVRFIRLDVEEQGVVARWIDASGSDESVVVVPEALDGDWRKVQLNISALINNFSLAEMVAGGVVTLGGSTDSSSRIIVKRQTSVETEELTTISSDLDAIDSETATDLSILPPSQFFRGCLNEFRIGELLLPFFEASALSSDPAPRKFQVTSRLDDIELECRLCYDHECLNDAVCLDPAANYTCDCLVGYEGDLCQVNIDECVDNLCDKGTCVDGVANYTCACDLGWTSWLCDEEINECEPNPCQNEATCTDLIGTYLCNCTEDYTGNDCEKLKVVTCANSPCLQGECSDVYDPVTQLANNFTCQCPFGYQGLTCDTEIDYCVSLAPCQNGAICTPFPFEPGFICECAEGYSGDVCELDINECTQRPCLNGGRCIDGLNNFTCDCDGTGFEGYLCEVDIDECRHSDPCINGRCVNSAGSYNCICDSDDDCGKNCDRKDPCKNDSVCFNGASCIAYCDELDAVTNSPVYTCSCLEGFEGRNCSVQSLMEEEPNTRLVIIIVPVVMAVLLIALVGTIIFVMMARNKRATRGTYSPSRQEMFSPRVEMGQVMKPPPEERLI